MPGKNITQAEAALRSTQLKVDSYNVHIDLTSGDETFIATPFTNDERHVRRIGQIANFETKGSI